jgi:hypothetical protein
MDKWFFEIDTAGSGYVGGAQAVAFLKNSNLGRDTLRAIWSLVDANNTGRVDLYQVVRAYLDLRGFAPSLTPIHVACPSSTR